MREIWAIIVLLTLLACWSELHRIVWLLERAQGLG